ncbi:hypothetical protein DYB32_000044 [Aphanomyces invadans]|uniref:Uncharacterized protein n=1 Tax=Aphanomyces invadans TaxID=157072 RepID=A0A3R6WUM8_9STRA|nr:hypothetical protein DYB32_000044 [Aphanomyces invadans]
MPPNGSRLHFFKAKPHRSKYDHSHDFDIKPGTPEPASHPNGGMYASTRSIVDILSDDGRGDSTDDSRTGRLIAPGSTTIITTDKSLPLSKELVALKSIQGRIDNASTFDSTDTLTPLTWKVGEILMATHESLTMASGFNERLFTKDMDEVKILMSRDSQSVVDDWATESTPVMRKLTNLFRQTVKTLQDMQAGDTANTRGHMSASSAAVPSTKIVHAPTATVSEDAAKLVQRLQNEKAILLGQLQETSNMYTSIAEVVKEREDEAKRLKTLLHGKVDEITRLKHEIFVLNNEEGKREEQERTVAHWKEKYMTLFSLHQTLETKERDATIKATGTPNLAVRHRFHMADRFVALAAQVLDLTEREAQAQTLLQENQELLSKAHDDIADKAEELARRQSVQLHGIAHEYEHEIRDLKAKLKEIKAQLGESQIQHKKALDRQRTEMKKHFDSVLAAGHHGFTERHLHVDNDLLRSRNGSMPVAHANTSSLVMIQHHEPQQHAPLEGHGMHDDDENDANMEDSDAADDDSGGHGPNITDDDDDFDEREVHDQLAGVADCAPLPGDDPNLMPQQLPPQTGGMPRSRRQSVQEQTIHKHLSGLINKAFAEGSVAQAMASVVPPSEMLSSAAATRRKSIMMAGPKGVPVQVEVPEGVTLDDDPAGQGKIVGESKSRRVSLKGSLSAHDLASGLAQQITPELGDAEAVFNASMQAMDKLSLTGAIESSPDMTLDDRIHQLQLQFGAEKAILKRKFIDSMCLFRHQMIDQYDKKATELMRKHRAEVIRIATVAETKYGKLLDEKDDLLREAKRTIKSLYKSLAVTSTDTKTVPPPVVRVMGWPFHLLEN